MHDRKVGIEQLLQALLRIDRTSGLAFALRAKPPLAESICKVSAKLAHLKSCDLSSIDAPKNVMGALNECGLLFALGGDLVAAKNLVLTALDTCKRFINRGLPKFWELSLIEPYLNLARIEALVGETNAALDKLKRTYNWAFYGAPLEIGGVAMDAIKLEDSLKQKENAGQTRISFYANVAMSYLSDSAKALMIADRNGEALEFLEDLRPRKLVEQLPFWWSTRDELCGLAAFNAQIMRIASSNSGKESSDFQEH